ncbi:MAG: pyridoxamine 5'-phosphate oxidase [Legionellaceae bacterium]|nr:pyridoxamine 5'-phosphate oxidase [Legionellaceae bacterium]
MSRIDDIHSIRQEYGDLDLLEENMSSDPIQQFETWFAQHVQTEQDTPNSMVLSTVDEHGRPDSRVILLKGLDKGSFVFYTNYYSAKGSQLDFNPHAALNFFWPEAMRQVRIRGKVSRVDGEKSDEYFHTRPLASQLSAVASPQSKEISSRNKLYEDFNKVVEQYSDKQVNRPDSWGGYELTPNEIEFWQGRDNRLHDRIQYYYTNGTWSLRRLAP